MTLLLFLAAFALAILLCLSTYVQLLYLESVRLRTRESAALEHFKEELEDRLGLKGDTGILTFSLLKHTSLVLFGVVVLAIVGRHMVPLWQTFLEAGLMAWLGMVVVCYVIPPTLYKRTSGRWMNPLAPLLRALAFLMKPLVWILDLFQSLAELRGGSEAAEDPADPSEHIEALIDAGTEEGIIEEDDRKLIQSVVAFGDKQVREVMTPRPNIVGIAHDRSLEDLRQLVFNEQFSRIPVYEGTIDKIIGFVHVKDMMFESDEQQRTARRVRELARPIKFVPETKSGADLLKEMQTGGLHMVIVVDEYGNTAGLVTMEDLVEEILGEIRDEHEPARDVTVEAGGAYVVSGSFDLDHLEDLLGFRPEAEIESTTVGGLVTEWAGRVPGRGESIEHAGLRLEVLAGNEMRVEKVRISKAPVSRTNGEGGERHA
ncbi:MAG: hemolysin family protein [Bryobacteraceae bacterium]|nr:hemolysin family protein [Bryobacteraceae bacterium]